MVRLTDAAMEDLTLLARKVDPQVVRWALKKMLLLQRDPEAGEELRGALIGFRKLTVSDRDWRVVWRVSHDAGGRTIVDVAEVWAVGARSDSEVYAEMQSRVQTLSRSPKTVPLAEALERLGKAAHGIMAAEEPVSDALPDWLIHVLTRVVKMPEEEVKRLTEAQARGVWDAYTQRPGT